jgi:hypothetical protein
MAGPDKKTPDLILIPGTCRERFLPLAGDFARPLRDAGIVFSGVSELHTGYEIGRPAKNFHLVVFSVGGEALYRTPDPEGVFSPGDLWIVPQPVPQHYWVGKEWRIFWFHLADIEQWAFLCAQPAHIRRSHAPRPLQSAMEQYVSECVSKEPGSERAARKRRIVAEAKAPGPLKRLARLSPSRGNLLSEGSRRNYASWTTEAELDMSQWQMRR